MSLLSDDEKTEIQGELQAVRDTFSRDIYVYVKKPTKKPSTVPSDHNALYGRAKTSSNNVASGESYDKFTYSAVIRYSDGQGESTLDEQAQFNLDGSEGSVIIKVSKIASDKIKIATRVEIDDELYVMDGDPKKVGPFSPQAYRIKMKREN